MTSLNLYKDGSAVKRCCGLTLLFLFFFRGGGGGGGGGGNLSNFSFSLFSVTKMCGSRTNPYFSHGR